jgi:hypothetical protein
VELLTVIFRILVGVGSKIVADEIKAWCPTITARIVRSAAQRLFPDQRERYVEEWTSDLAQVPGSVSKVLFALDLHRAAFGINLNLRRSRRLQVQKMGNELLLAIERSALLSAFVVTKVYVRLRPLPTGARPLDVVQLSRLKKEMTARPWKHDDLLAEVMKDLGYTDNPRSAAG